MISVEQQVVIFRLLPNALAADVFEYLDLDAQKKLLKALGQEDAVKILNEMTPGRSHGVAGGVAGAAVTQLLNLLSPAERTTATALLGYPEGSVGG